jgi:hypothetical protein
MSPRIKWNLPSYGKNSFQSDGSHRPREFCTPTVFLTLSKISRQTWRISPRRPVFDHKSVYMGFVVEVALGKHFCSPFSVIIPHQRPTFMCILQPSTKYNVSNSQCREINRRRKHKISHKRHVCNTLHEMIRAEYLSKHKT